MLLNLAEVVRSDTGVMLLTIELLQGSADYVMYFWVRVSFLHLLITYKMKVKNLLICIQCSFYHLFRSESSPFGTTSTTSSCD